MTRAVWKYEVHPNRHLRLPDNARPLHVEAVNDRAYLWAEVDPTPRHRR